MENIKEKVIANAAKELGMSVEEFKREIWEEVHRMHAMEDIECWLADHDIECTDEEKDKILRSYIDHHDAEYGTWDNISGAYDAVIGYVHY